MYQLSNLNGKWENVQSVNGVATLSISVIGLLQEPVFRNSSITFIPVLLCFPEYFAQLKVQLIWH